MFCPNQPKGKHFSNIRFDYVRQFQMAKYLKKNIFILINMTVMQKRNNTTYAAVRFSVAVFEYKQI